MYNPKIITLIEPIGTSCLHVVQYTNHISTKIPLLRFCREKKGRDQYFYSVLDFKSRVHATQERQLNGALTQEWLTHYPVLARFLARV